MLPVFTYRVEITAIHGGKTLFLLRERGREDEISVAEEFKGPVWKILKCLSLIIFK